MPLPFPFKLKYRILSRLIYNLMNLFSGKYTGRIRVHPPISPIKGYIENQSAPELSGIKYGNLPLYKNGCGAIALYNYIYHKTGSQPSLANIIKTLENKGIILKGRHGTAPKGILVYMSSFKNHTSDTPPVIKLYKYKSKARLIEVLRDVERTCNSCILLSIYDVRQLKYGLHYMAITKDREGFSIHNAGDSSPAHADTLLEAISYPVPGASLPVCIIL